MVGKCVPIRLCCLLPAACCRIVFFMRLPFGEDALVGLLPAACCCLLLPAACCRIVFFMRLPFGEDALVRLHRRGCPLVGLPWWGIVFPLDCA